MILIIDDDQESLDILHSFVQKVSGLSDDQIIKLTNSELALEFIKSNDVKLVFTDIMMPDLNGIEFVAEVRKFSQIPIVCVSGLIDVVGDDIAKLPNVYLVAKPFTREQIKDYLLLI